ncbi:MAG: hypothetical protein MZV63_30245 [Marinilabiliales bacterium]|nr:hypothetical protein [Marinilabiliales bacterium]
MGLEPWLISVVSEKAMWEKAEAGEDHRLHGVRCMCLYLSWRRGRCLTTSGWANLQ